MYVAELGGGFSVPVVLDMFNIKIYTLKAYTMLFDLHLNVLFNIYAASIINIDNSLFDFLNIKHRGNATV